MKIIIESLSSLQRSGAMLTIGRVLAFSTCLMDFFVRILNKNVVMIFVDFVNHYSIFRLTCLKSSDSCFLVHVS